MPLNLRNEEKSTTTSVYFHSPVRYTSVSFSPQFSLRSIFVTKQTFRWIGKMDERCNSDCTEVVRMPTATSSTDFIVAMQQLNFKLQLKVQALEEENTRLRNEVFVYRTKSKTTDNLTIEASTSADLASLRKQLEKATDTILKKAKAYEKLEKELKDLKAKHSEATGILKTPKRAEATGILKTPKRDGLKKISFSSLHPKPFIYEDPELSPQPLETAKRHSETTGSFSNLLYQITREESRPSPLLFAGAPASAFRMRFLKQLHLKAASTESLESAGRKSMNAQDAFQPVAAPRGCPERPQSGLITSNQPQASVSNSSSKVPPSVRPALGISNGQQRMIKINKPMIRSTRITTNKAVPVKPAFRL